MPKAGTWSQVEGLGYMKFAWQDLEQQHKCRRIWPKRFSNFQFPTFVHRLAIQNDPSRPYKSLTLFTGLIFLSVPLSLIPSPSPSTSLALPYLLSRLSSGSHRAAEHSHDLNMQQFQSSSRMFTLKYMYVHIYYKIAE